MRLYELAYCCHAYVFIGGYDPASVELREVTGAAVNPGNKQHLAPLFNWLRRWGCRQFSIADEPIARNSIVGWWREWERRLPRVRRTLDEIEDRELDAIADAFEDLRGRQAGWQQRKTG